MKKEYDLNKRTLEFAKDVIRLCKSLENDIVNRELIKQVIRSGGSVGANYREGSESLGEKDKIMRFKISRKEAKETIFWLELIQEANQIDICDLINESNDLVKIFSKIISKLKD
jgi:four helix bundle protein